MRPVPEGAGRFAFYGRVDDRTAVLQSARPLLMRMALVSYGSVAALERRRGGDAERIGPPGESSPMHEVWADALHATRTAGEAQAVLDQARAEFNGYMRRQLAPDTTETWEELASRIVSDGWGVTAEECSRAMRCTPSLVRRARLAEMRHPESGYPLPARARDPMAWARKLEREGLSLRQIEAITGVPKSTLHRVLASNPK
jgi:hypothetical protein